MSSTLFDFLNVSFLHFFEFHRDSKPNLLSKPQSCISVDVTSIHNMLQSTDYQGVCT